MKSPIVEARDLVKRFQPPWTWRHLRDRGPEKTALAGVGMTVEPGEIFGLLGPNGAGKTSLLRILVGLLTSDAGTVVVNGHDVVTSGFAEVLAIAGVKKAKVGQTELGWSLVTLVLGGKGAALPTAIRHLLDHPLEIVTCTRQELSLDEIFRELVGRRRQEVGS